MGVITVILYALVVLAGLLLTGLILIQPSKGGGMGSAFGGGFGEEVFGGRTGNVLSRTTVVLGIILILNSLAIAYCMRGGLQSTSLAERTVEAPAAPAVPEAPAQ